MMVGRDLEPSPTHRSVAQQSSETVLQVVNFTRTKKLPSAPAIMLRSMRLELRRGEILGLAGLVGAGRTELVRAIFGIDPIESGKLFLQCEAIVITSARDAIRH